ncbi:hypothetical protein P171DRAFT_18222 [Karstenula rhodostoma CBS 690.94]|uniref:Uncharacterized protein n=1 Tax=Karstenula rhodostoma CBS 690.94 TaxID=1392251 RepID=A0A9P4UK78_9PLEO|nr:hypothetical protein P171DRAFT_18222 [Karstenula rhodostoma CBS 690.94]
MHDVSYPICIRPPYLLRAHRRSVHSHPAQTPAPLGERHRIWACVRGVCGSACPSSDGGAGAVLTHRRRRRLCFPRRVVASPNPKSAEGCGVPSFAATAKVNNSDGIKTAPSVGRRRTHGGRPAPFCDASGSVADPVSMPSAHDRKDSDQGETYRGIPHPASALFARAASPAWSRTTSQARDRSRSVGEIEGVMLALLCSALLCSATPLLCLSIWGAASGCAGPR